MARDAMDKEFAALRGKLLRYSNSLGSVIADTINTVAREAHDDSARNMQSRFTLRNSYTLRSLRFYKANDKKEWHRINAISGSTSPYMAIHDQGGSNRPKQGGKVAMPTLYARGGSRSRTKRRSRWLGQDISGGELKKKFFVGKPKGGGKPVGIYERTNGNKKIRMTHNLENASVKITARHWHTDAVERKYTKQRIYNEFVARAKQKLASLGR